MTNHTILAQMELPDTWGNIQLRWLSRRYAGGTPDKNNPDYWEDGTIPWLNSGVVNQGTVTKPSAFITELALKESSAKWIPEDGLVIALAGQGKTKGMVGHLALTTTGNQSLAAVVPTAIQSRFLYWWLTSQYLNIRNLSSQDGRDGLNLEMIGGIRCPVPAIETQNKIAAYLDEKTTQIDGLIEKKRALLDRLAEKHQALITQAVTKGLNPSAAMKDSGIDWLGYVPEHWDVSRLSFKTDVIDCKHRTPEYIEDGIPLVSTTEIKPYRIDYQTKRNVSDEEFAIMSEGDRSLRVNDIVYSRNASVGSAARVQVTDPVCLGQDLCIIRPTGVSSKYLEYFLNSDTCLEQLNRELVGATFKRVNVDVIKKYFLLLPPKEEQVSIVEFLDVRVGLFVTAILSARDNVAKLQEYRAAVISSAVTGKIAGLQ